MESFECICIDRIETSFTHAHAHTHRALRIPSKRERESEETRTRPRQTDRPNVVIKKSCVKMQGGDHNDVVNPNGGGEKQAEIYTHDAPWLIYACNWSVRCCVLFYTRVVVFVRRRFGVWFLCVLTTRVSNRMRSPRENGYVSPQRLALFFLSLCCSEKKDD